MTRRQTATGLIAILVIAVAAYFYWPFGQSTGQQTGQSGQQPQKGVQQFGKGPGAKGGQFGGAFRGGNAEPAPVLVTAARLADVPVYLDGVGTARARNTVTVKPQVDGKLVSILFKEGQEVQRGDVLARIDPTTYQAQLDQAVAKKAQDEAQLANARLDLERFTRLSVSNAATKQQLDTQQAMVNQLEALVKIDQASIDNVRAILNYTNVTAPISGRTGIRQVDEGNLVRASDTTGLVVITELKPISVFFNLPQQQIRQVNKGMAGGVLQVEALASDSPAVLDRGMLLVVDNQVDQTTGTVKLRAEFPNAEMQLWPGQFVNVRLLIDTLKQVVVVPTSAVQRGPDGTFVFIARDDETVALRPVTVTQQDDVRSVVDKGLQNGERVVTAGFSRLAEGSRIRPTLADENGQPVSGATPPAAAPRQGIPEAGRGDRRRPQKGSGTTGAATPAPGAATAAPGAPP